MGMEVEEVEVEREVGAGGEGEAVEMGGSEDEGEGPIGEAAGALAGSGGFEEAGLGAIGTEGAGGVTVAIGVQEAELGEDGDAEGRSGRLMEQEVLNLIAAASECRGSSPSDSNCFRVGLVSNW